MTEKPTYEELERRIQDLEAAESIHRRLEITLRENEEKYRSLIDASPLPFLITQNEVIVFVNAAALKLFGLEDESAIIGSHPQIWIHDDYREIARQRRCQAIETGDTAGSAEMVLVGRDDRKMTVLANTVRITHNGAPATLSVFQDITERSRAEEELKRYDWIIEKEILSADSTDPVFESPYGDITVYNGNRLILDVVKKENLEQMASDVMALLDTSLAVYESNGDYAYAIFTSSWCRNLDTAAFRLCGTTDVKKALGCGKWLCHENCWNDSAKAAMDSGKIVDIECVGGIRLYAVPVLAGNEIIGVVNIGYGNPPKDDGTLIQLSEKFNISFDLLRAKADAYKPRPDFIIELGKKRCQYMARMIGEIVERNRADENLRKSEARHGKMVANIGDVIVIIDEKGINRYKSPNIEKLFGWKPEEVVGANTWDNVHPDDIDSTRQFFENMMQTPNASGTMECRYRCKDGSYRWIEFSGINLLHDPDIQGLLGNYQDITGRKQAQKALMEKEALFRGLFDHMTSGSAVYEVKNDGSKGSDYIIREFNRKSLEMEGQKLEEVRGKSLFDLRPTIDDYGLIPVMKKVWETGTPEYYPAKIYQDGRFSNYYENHIFKLPSGEIVTIYNDVTDAKNQEMDLQESEEKYRVLFDTFPLGITVTDQSGNIVESNAVSEKLLGLSQTEHECRTIDEPTWRIVRPDGTPMPAAEYASVRALKEKRQIENVEMGIVKSNDEITWINVSAAPLNLEKYGVVVTYGDITKRKKAEEEYKTLFHEMLDGFALHEIVCNASGTPMDYRFLAINPAFERMTGLKAQEVIGRTVLEIMPGTEHYWIETYGKVALSGEPAFFENFAADIGKHFEVTAFQPRSGQFACIFQDITARKNAETMLLESEARFKALHNASFGGIAIHDKGVILECNQGLSEMTGYSVDELVGMNGLLLIAEKSRSAVMNNILTGYEKPYEAVGLRKNGEEFPMRLEARNIPYKGKQVRTVEFRDLTEQKQAEAEREKLQTQLNQAQKIESVGRLAGGVAHDFNNMLGVILGHAELALEKAQEDHDLYADLKEIQTAARRSADLTRQLLTFARKQIIDPRMLDLNHAVAHMLDMLRRLIGEDIDLAWEPAKELWPVKIDPSQIDQILANLCVNARDAIAGVGKVTIETGMKTFDALYCKDHAGFMPGDYVILAVSDNGCGMDKEILNNLFEPFFTTKDVNKGTGLGLATVYGIVKQNNGFINVYSEIGQGTTFRIYLPRYSNADALPAVTQPKKPDPVGTETILLVEDEPAILKMTRMMLERKGYSVLPAATPAEAINMAKAHPDKIHLIMTDVVMPEMNGRDLAQKISALYPDIRTLFMSGYTANVIAHQGVLDEGVAFIQKPFSMTDLAEKVREVLRESVDKREKHDR